MFKKITVLFFTLIVMVTGTLVVAQDSVEVDEVQFAAGEVTAVSESGITIIDYDYEDEQTVMFQVNDDTELENIQAMHEIMPGDEVYIDYVMVSRGNIAVNIFKGGVEMLDEEFSPLSGEYMESFDGSDEKNLYEDTADGQ